MGQAASHVKEQHRTPDAVNIGIDPAGQQYGAGAVGEIPLRIFVECVVCTGLDDNRLACGSR